MCTKDICRVCHVEVRVSGVQDSYRVLVIGVKVIVWYDVREEKPGVSEYGAVSSNGIGAMIV